MKEARLLDSKKLSDAMENEGKKGKEERKRKQPDMIYYSNLGDNRDDSSDILDAKEKSQRHI